jgi:hypothetical protein
MRRNGGWKREFERYIVLGKFYKLFSKNLNENLFNTEIEKS